MRSNIELTNFTAGELSQRMYGRVDYKGYFNGAAAMVNMVPMPQGGCIKRPPTTFVAYAKDQDNPCRLVPFIYSTVQAYMLEASADNIRVFKDGAAVLDGTNYVDIETPYGADDLAAVQYAQSADTLFAVHPDYPPATLTRSSHVDWTYAEMTFKDGPWLDVNTTETTVTVSGTSGSVTLTFSSTEGVNNGDGFSSSDVGRLIRIKLYSLWAWAKITAVASTTSVTATVQDKVNDGAWGAIDGAAWEAYTDYIEGVVVKNRSQYFYVSSAGRSAPSGANGPYGTGDAILDGTVLWKRVGAMNATKHDSSLSYEVDDIVVNSLGYYYQCTQGGLEGSSSTKLRGTSYNIEDGDICWCYLKPFTFPSDTKDWALGMWGTRNGYPYTVQFWQQRLFFGGCPGYPSRIVGSQTNDFNNMAPTEADGSTDDSSGVDWTIDDDQVNVLHWMIGVGSASAMGLGLGTLAGEHILQAASAATALSPTSVQAYGETAYGSAENVQPLRIGKVVLFADRTGRRLREWGFNWQVNGYTGPDKLQASEHITKSAVADGSGIKEMAWQQSPHQVIWAILNGGELVSFTYDREQDVFAPARHRLGGSYRDGAPRVESLAVIPSPDGSYDQLWLEVLRTVNGTDVRIIEVMEPFFDGGLQDDAGYLDCALCSSLTAPDATLILAGLTNTAEDAAMKDAWTGTASLVAGADVFDADADVGKILRVNGGKMRISAVTDAQNATATVTRPLSSVASAASGDWSLEALHTSFSGLSHLEGETVGIWGDGADLTETTVSSGAVSLDDGVSYARVGLKYTPWLISLPWEPVRAAAASSQGRIKRIDQLYVRFVETLGVRFGRRKTDPMTGTVETLLEDMESRESADQMDNAPPLFTGVRRLSPQGGYDSEGQIVITQRGAGPLTVTGIFARGDVGEMP